MDPRVEDHADVIVDHSVEIEAGDEVMISAPPAAADLVVALRERIGERGANAVTLGGSSRSQRAFMLAMDPDDYRKKMDLDWAAETIEAAADCANYFGPDSRVERGWAGLYAVTPDHHPIIGETLPGFVTAAGFSGHGFMQAPATGKLVAELIDEGEPSLVDVSSLGADRFDRGAHLEEGTVID